MPNAWHEARVAAIFKGGASGECKNYRPICLLSTGYKLFAAVMLQRLKSGGAEQRIRKTQYGFKARAGTTDALFVTRRMMDNAWASKNGSLLLLALDWSKAFDTVAPDNLFVALERFGIDAGFVDMVRAIYRDRVFFVQDGGQASDWHRQSFGICQGCPLSPFLFSIVMTMLLQDAEEELLKEFGPSTCPWIVTRDLLYADDTLIVESNAEVAQRFMDLIAARGAEYGLSLNWGKVKLLRVNHDGRIRTPEGADVEETSSLLYLGATLHSDARHGAEVSRRIGQAGREFLALQQVWKHAGLSKSQKLRVFDACIISTLLYGISTIWLNQGGRRRVDAFQAKCLRKVLGIPHSFISRVTNKAVLEEANALPLSSRVLCQQLSYFGKLARGSGEELGRKVVFETDRFACQKQPGPRRVGRPRQSWVTQVWVEALKIAGGSHDALQAMTAHRINWNNSVCAHCSSGGK